MTVKSTGKRLPLIAALALVLALIPGEHKAHAGSATLGLTIGASVDVRCTMLTTSIAFGFYNVMGGQATNPLDRNGNISLFCTQGGSIDIRLGQGVNPAPGSTNANPRRRMRSGANRMSYNLYEDAARTVVWDNVPKGLKGGTVFPVNIPVYGRIPAGQVLPPGTYTDTVVATVYF